MVLWGFPPHKAGKTLSNFVHLLAQLSEQRLTWHLQDRPDCRIPTSDEQWEELVEKYRGRSDYDTLDLFLDSPSGVSISLGVDAPVFVRDFDALAIGMDTEHLVGTQALFGFDKLYTLFTESIKLFQPFWGEVCDHELTRTDRIDSLRSSIDRTLIPDTIHWFNYFDEEMVERLGGRTKLRAAPVYQVAEWDNPPGLLLVLGRDPFDYHNPEHRQRHDEITQYLELDRLHKLYPKRR
jgi:hypothetical protein